MKNVLVIGGAGFLGAALAWVLKGRGVSVRAFDLVAHPDPSIPTQLGDLRDRSQVRTACEGVEVVFQTAALVDWGPRSKDRLYAVNVEGNRNVISACQKLGGRMSIVRSYSKSRCEAIDWHTTLTPGSESRGPSRFIGPRLFLIF